jgi:4-carboxymuconolactone decarboxylase
MARDGCRPDDMNTDEALVYDFCTELLHCPGVGDASYRTAVERFGERDVIDLVSLVGYFVISTVLNVARTPAVMPAGTAPLPAFPL